MRMRCGMRNAALGGFICHIRWLPSASGWQKSKYRIEPVGLILIERIRLLSIGEGQESVGGEDSRDENETQTNMTEGSVGQSKSSCRVLKMTATKRRRYIWSDTYFLKLFGCQSNQKFNRETLTNDVQTR